MTDNLEKRVSNLRDDCFTMELWNTERRITVQGGREREGGREGEEGGREEGRSEREKGGREGGRE